MIHPICEGELAAWGRSALSECFLAQLTKSAELVKWVRILSVHPSFHPSIHPSILPSVKHLSLWLLSHWLWLARGRGFRVSTTLSLAVLARGRGFQVSTSFHWLCWLGGVSLSLFRPLLIKVLSVRDDKQLSKVLSVRDDKQMSRKQPQHVSA